MGRPKLDHDLRRMSSAIHYHTFPTPPPKTKGQPPSDTSSNDGGPRPSSSDSQTQGGTPLPVKQLCVLAVIALCEQTALNSISPYLPQMASTFPEVKGEQVGLYVGTIASSFALAQFATNFFWGWLSDRVGRKPVVLTGTLLTAACFVAFGFVRTLWQAIVVQVFVGLVNGNQGVVSTCLGEITDRSNQSRAFIYLPVIYGLGGITGPMVGGLLVKKGAHPSQQDPYPYLRPNILAATVLLVDLIVSMIWLEESLEEAKNLPPLGKRVGNLFSWVWQFAGNSTRPSYLRRGRGRTHDKHHHGNGVDGNGVDGAVDEDDDSDESETEDEEEPFLQNLLPHNETEIKGSGVFNRDTVLLMATYLIFQLSNISYNSLYPIFGQSPPPRGRDLSPEEIGFSLAFAGAATIVFQLGIFGKLRDKMGNKVTYRVCIAAIAVAFILTPWVGYKDTRNGDGGISSGKAWLWVELGIVLLIKSLAAVGCLTSFLLLITNSAPNHSVLGTLNGLAQTLSAAGRAAGPFFAGGLFSLTTKVEPKGEAVAFGVFGAITFVGFLLAFGIRGDKLETDGVESDQEDDESDDEDRDEEHARYR